MKFPCSVCTICSQVAVIVRHSLKKAQNPNMTSSCAFKKSFNKSLVHSNIKDAINDYGVTNCL